MSNSRLIHRIIMLTLSLLAYLLFGHLQAIYIILLACFTELAILNDKIVQQYRPFKKEVEEANNELARWKAMALEELRVKK